MEPTELYLHKPNRLFFLGKGVSVDHWLRERQQGAEEHEEQHEEQKALQSREIGVRGT